MYARRWHCIPHMPLAWSSAVTLAPLPVVMTMLTKTSLLPRLLADSLLELRDIF